MKTIGSIMALSIALAWSPLAVAETRGGGTNRSAEPQRSTASINVIMYQTSW
jgi:hypothetical protein